MTADDRGRHPPTPELEYAKRHLLQVYLISKHLAQFESVADTLPVVAAEMAESIVLYTVVLIEESGASYRASGWRAPGTSPNHQQAAIANLRRHYAQWTPTGRASAAASILRQVAWTTLPGTVAEGVDTTVGPFIVVPLVNGRQEVFGAMQVEAALLPDEADLAFVNAVGNQVALALDRSHARQHQHVLRERAEAAELAQKAMMAAVAHDLRTPLSVILLNATYLQMKLSRGETGQPVSQRLDNIRRAAEWMEQMIRDLLDQASIEAGKLTLHRQAVSVKPLIAEAIELLAPLAAERDVRIDSRIAEALPPIDGDRFRILQVLTNLFGNAIKFSPAGSTVTLAAASTPDGVQVSVTDQGPGISGSDLPHLFERRWQAASTAHLGTGLGLSIAKGIVAAHGGRIWAESTQGSGTTFAFTLPAAVAGAQAA